MIYFTIPVLLLSFYSVFLSRDGTELSRGLLRALLSTVLMTTLFFKDKGISELGGLIFSVIILFVISITRSDLQGNDGNRNRSV